MRELFLVAGGGGFIGGHLVADLLRAGHAVRAVDVKPIEEWWQVHAAAANWTLNLEEKWACQQAMDGCSIVYNLACNLGGVGYLERHRALCMLGVLINTHLLMAAREHQVRKYLFCSSACVYPLDAWRERGSLALREEDAYPAMPENSYGWEKLFSERMCAHFHEDFGLDVRVVRFHNVYGPHGPWRGGRERAPAAICRKVIEARRSGRHEIEIWGDGEQTRSFMYIDDCLQGLGRLMASSFTEPLNLGREELVTINQLVTLAEEFAGVRLERKYDLTAPQGVRGRNSDNTLIRRVLGWEPEIGLREGLRKTFDWIAARTD